MSSNKNFNIKNLIYNAKDVGKTFKAYIISIFTFSSKRLYTWEFDFNDKFRRFELFHSKLSAKRKIVYNGKTVNEFDG